MKKAISSKILILVLFIIFLASGTALGYSYWNNLTQESNESIYLGDWWVTLEGTPLSSTQEFYEAVTNTNSSSDDIYYLTQDLDFTDFDWTYNSTLDDVIFRGTLSGNGYTISNLTIYTSDTSHTYFGLFARSDGGTVKDITFQNVELDMSSTALSRSSMRTGLIFGRVYNGSTTTISNVTLIDCGVRGTSGYGTGGLVGQVYRSNTTLNISNIKATNLKVFSTRYNIGGLVGYIYTSSSQVNITNVDIDVELYSDYSYSYSGGLVGKLRSGTNLSVNNAIIEMSTQNTLETSIGYLDYTGRYVGGVIGYNQSSSSNVTINNTFFTGSMIVYSSKYYNYVATLIGRNRGSYTTENTYYSNVEFENSSGNTTYSLTNSKGVMSTLVNSDSMPSLTWWDSFTLEFDSDIWGQDETGKLYLLD